MGYTRAMAYSWRAEDSVAFTGDWGTQVVASSVHEGFFNTSGGYELPAAYGLVGSVLTLTGAGRYSLDSVTGGVLDKPWMRAVAYASALAASVVIIRARQLELATRPQPEPEADAVGRDAATQD